MRQWLQEVLNFCWHRFGPWEPLDWFDESVPPEEEVRECKHCGRWDTREVPIYRRNAYPLTPET